VKKDIDIPESKDVHMALVPEETSERSAAGWYAYVLNQGLRPLEMVLVVSEGHDGSRKTSKMRHSISLLPALSFAKVELVQEEVLSLNNVFFVTYFADNKLYEKRFVFEKQNMATLELGPIPLLKKDGIFAK
jgi:hypothetical protein